MTAIAITAVGCVSALGRNVPESWQRACAGADDTIQAIPYFDASAERSGIAAPAMWDGAEDQIEGQSSRTDLMSLMAVSEALRASGLTAQQIRPAGVFLGAGTGGLHQTERIFGRDRKAPSLQYVDYLVHNGDVTAQKIAVKWGLQGPSRAIMTACSSSVLAIGEAVDHIRLGLLDVAIAGGADSITQLTHAGFNSLQAVDSEPCRPFSNDRAGMNLGECAAFLVLESIDHARQRRATTLANIRGYGLSCDAHHMTAPPDDGCGAARAIQAALADAGIRGDRIDMINAHGTATPLNDAAETQAIQACFPGRTKPLFVTGTKSMTGHCLGAAGAIEAVLTVLSLRDQCIPPTLRVKQSLLPHPFQLVTDSHFHTDLDCALSSSFAFGGNNGVLVFERVV